MGVLIFVFHSTNNIIIANDITIIFIIFSSSSSQLWSSLRIPSRKLRDTLGSFPLRSATSYANTRGDIIKLVPTVLVIRFNYLFNCRTRELKKNVRATELRRSAVALCVVSAPYCCWTRRATGRVEYLCEWRCLQRLYVPGQRGRRMQHLSRRWYVETPSILPKMLSRVSLARVRALSSGGVYRGRFLLLPQLLKTRCQGVKFTSSASHMRHYWYTVRDCTQCWREQKEPTSIFLKLPG